jgi:4a-hydroxytetrahydrobiopterin dehydratase
MEQPLTRARASAAVVDLGWRLVLGRLVADVPATSLADATAVAALIVSAAGPDSDDHVQVDSRPDRVAIAVQSVARHGVTGRDVDVVHAISAALAAAGREVTAGTGQAPRSVQALEIAVDALDIEKVRPFWRAAFGYVDGPSEDLIDPHGQGPSIWFQQMDRARPQRNRIHFDISVPHDEAAARIDAIVAAGGRHTYDEAPAFWVLADPEGNEVCVCTWQGRD